MQGRNPKDGDGDLFDGEIISQREYDMQYSSWKKITQVCCQNKQLWSHSFQLLQTRVDSRSFSQGSSSEQHLNSTSFLCLSKPNNMLVSALDY